MLTGTNAYIRARPGRVEYPLDRAGEILPSLLPPQKPSPALLRADLPTGCNLPALYSCGTRWVKMVVTVVCASTRRLEEGSDNAGIRADRGHGVALDLQSGLRILAGKSRDDGQIV